MEILNKKRIRSLNSLRMDFTFDKLSELEDVIRVGKILESFGAQINNIIVSEYGDWEDAPLSLGYSNLDNLNKCSDDFNNKIIDNYLFNGEFKDTLYHVAIYPGLNKMIVRYHSDLQEELINKIEKYWM